MFNVGNRRFQSSSSYPQNGSSPTRDRNSTIPRTLQTRTDRWIVVLRGVGFLSFSGISNTVITMFTHTRPLSFLLQIPVETKYETLCMRSQIMTY